MAVTWGSTVWRTGTGSNPHSVGIRLGLDGARVYWELRVKDTYNNTDDNQTASISGAASGSWSFRNTGGERVVGSGNFAGARGSSYSFTGSLSGVYGNNNNVPNVPASITVPALVPATPNRPTQSGITSTTIRVATNAVNGNGASVTEYVWSTEPASELTGVSTTGPGPYVFGGFAADTLYSIGVRARNAVGWSGWSAGLSVRTLPLAPNAPTSVSASRASDTQVNLSWTRNAISGRPYASQEPCRREWSGTEWGAWVRLASISGTATSYTDSTTRADRRYQYRVRAVNAAGGADSTATGSVETTPAAPSSVTAVKTGAGDILVTITRAPAYPVQTEVWHQLGGGSWALLTTLAASQSATLTHTHTDPSIAVTHAYRVRHKSAAPVLYSGYATSGVVQLAAPPNAPLVTGPAGAQDAQGGLTLTWAHNPVDSSPQSAYALRYRTVGASTWTTITKTTSGTSARAFAAGTFTNGTSVEFQVMTWGQHATGSPWSATYVVALSARPTASINSPGALVTASAVTVAWGYYQAQGHAQSSARIALIDSGGVEVETRTVTGTTTTRALTTRLPDGSTWTIRVQVQSATGQWSTPTTVTISVSYRAPSPPVISAEWDADQGAVVASIYNPVAPAEPPIVQRDPNGEIWFDW